MAILVRTLLTFHFMAISVAWDARPEKKVKFSALFPKQLHTKTPQFGRHLALVWPTRDQQTNEKLTTSSGQMSAANGGLREAPWGV